MIPQVLSILGLSVLGCWRLIRSFRTKAVEFGTSRILGLLDRDVPVHDRGSGTLAWGRVLRGDFRVLRKVRSGEGIAVYEGLDLARKQPIAIHEVSFRVFKEGDPENTGETIGIEYPIHPNIARPYMGHDCSGRPLDVRLLSDILAKRKTLSLSDSAGLLREICCALDFAHHGNFINHILQTSEVFITEEGEVKVMGFAVLPIKGIVSSLITRPGSNLPYMAPEQMLASKLSDAVKASNFYNIGVMAYEMVTGELPFKGGFQEMLDKKLKREFLPVSRRDLNLPPTLDAFFAKALEPNPLLRFRTGAELVKAFEEAAGIDDSI